LPATSPVPPRGAQACPDGLVDVPGLQALAERGNVCLLDCRHDLARPELGLEQYREGHIPGAVFAHLDRDLAGPRSAGSGRHPLPDRDVLAARLRAWGVNQDSCVVVYDASDGSFAARAWWLLRWLGHPGVALLDGGWPAWRAAGAPVQVQAPAPAPGNFVAGAPLQAVASLESVQALVARGPGSTAVPGAPRRLIVDARAPDRYAGENETVDPVAGHIPGAVNRFWKRNLDGSGRFLAAERLRADYEELLEGRAPGEVIAQCGSGVTACHDLLAMHVAGLRGAALYPGSWSEWIADAMRPVATGALAWGE
jgi:thiosulfate/3-mercaptopyruvate sulfurtransferase